MNDSEKFFDNCIKNSQKETQNLFLVLKGTTFYFYTKTNILLHETVLGNMIITLYPSI